MPVLFYKKIGETPLETIKRFRGENPQYQQKKIAYAGRLDPMAHGQLLLLLGEECKQRCAYQRFDKVYKVDILFGLQTDTFDILGKHVSSSGCQPQYSAIEKVLESFVGEFQQEYPPYSSVRVKGKPLFYWAREAKLQNIEIPKKMVKVYAIKIVDKYRLSAQEIYRIVEEKIKLVKQDFRQEAILADWKVFADKFRNKKFVIYKLEISCSSGVYVRSISNEMGIKLKTGAIAFAIERITFSI